MHDIQSLCEAVPICRPSDLQIQIVKHRFLAEFYFNKGYTFFTKKQYTRSKALLEKVKFNSVYESDAHYYLGHIAYQLEDYSAASNSFNQVSKKDQQQNLGYFQVEMNYKLGRFEKAITLGEK